MRHALFASLVLCACSSTHVGDDGSTPSDFAGAYIRRDCAPDDGLAYRLLLWDQAVPECSADGARRSLSFTIFEGTDLFFPLSNGTSITSTASGVGFGNGTATACPGGTPPCLSSQSWTLTFDTFEDMSRANGSYSITWEDGSTTSGRFDATWCEVSPPLCG